MLFCCCFIIVINFHIMCFRWTILWAWHVLVNVASGLWSCLWQLPMPSQAYFICAWKKKLHSFSSDLMRLGGKMILHHITWHFWKVWILSIFILYSYCYKNVQASLVHYILATFFFLKKYYFESIMRKVFFTDQSFDCIRSILMFVPYFPLEI